MTPEEVGATRAEWAEKRAKWYFSTYRSRVSVALSRAEPREDGSRLVRARHDERDQMPNDAWDIVVRMVAERLREKGWEVVDDTSGTDKHGRFIELLVRPAAE